QVERFDRVDSFADEHRSAFRIERAIAREYDVVGAEKRNAAGKRRGGTAEDGVAVEHLEVLDRRLAQLLQYLGFFIIRRTRTQLGPERFGPSSEVRNHAAAVVRDDAQLRQPLQQPRE